MKYEQFLYFSIHLYLRVLFRENERENFFKQNERPRRNSPDRKFLITPLNPL